ncbi:hypothetical protein ABIB06_002532 [Bradyrhizobium sp. LB8.2]|uniref:hypothetical protein n=1 Tax=unclassified Bradyrhizobium TaxID=2631580 RepID=UPI0033973AA0
MRWRDPRDPRRRDAQGAIHQVAGFELAEKLADKLGWGVADVQPWIEGTFAFDVDGQLAKVLQLNVPMLVGKALEVTLRPAEGGRP